ncbi:MAG: ATP-binding cassette domain-containing protein [Pyrinomonadaceae bacterium]
MENRMKPDAISLTDVRKSFGSLVAVDSVSLSVNEGEIFGLLGPNGAGKTTLIRMIMDIIRPDSGTVEIFGRPLRDEDKERIGYLPEERGLYARQKVFSTLVYFGRLKGLDKSTARRRAGEWLERLDMTAVSDKKVGELSKGNQQKIQLIATLVADPEIVVLDEPLSGLDPVGARMVMSLLRELAVAGKTILLSSHQMSTVETLCRHVLMIYRGRAVLHGDLEEIKRRYADDAMLLKSDGDYALCPIIARYTSDNGSAKIYLKENASQQELFDWLSKTGAVVTSFKRETPSLEDIFIRVVEEGK